MCGFEDGLPLSLFFMSHAQKGRVFSRVGRVSTAHARVARGKIDTHSRSSTAVYSALYIWHVSEVTQHYATKSGHACYLCRAFFCGVIKTIVTYVQHTSRSVGLHVGGSVLDLSVVYSIRERLILLRITLYRQRAERRS